jgi:hypothetical protein
LYEVRVVVANLDDASNLLRVLNEAGYSQVSMGQPVSGGGHVADGIFERAKSSLNRLNDWIMIALSKSEANDKTHGISADKIVSALQGMPETGDLFNSRGEGIVSRTVSMVASSVLADKLGWVDYEKKQPRVFWLTPAGEKKAKLLVGDNK